VFNLAAKTAMYARFLQVLDLAATFQLTDKACILVKFFILCLYFANQLTQALAYVGKWFPHLKAVNLSLCTQVTDTGIESLVVVNPQSGLIVTAGTFFRLAPNCAQLQ